MPGNRGQGRPRHPKPGPLAVQENGLTHQERAPEYLDALAYLEAPVQLRNRQSPHMATRLRPQAPERFSEPWRAWFFLSSGSACAGRRTLTRTDAGQVNARVCFNASFLGFDAKQSNDLTARSDVKVLSALLAVAHAATALLTSRSLVHNYCARVA